MTTSTLTLTASSTAAPAAATVRISGTSGSLTSTVTLLLTVTAAPAFTISASPASVSLAPGTSGASTITITQQNGFSGAVTLTASGLPAGVTASFGAITAGHSTLTFKAASPTAATSTVTITGASGNLTAKTAVTLVIAPIAPPPAFALSASPTALSIPQGGTGNSTLTLTAQNGFSGTVTVSLSGLPSGVVGSFGPGPTAASVTLTLNVTASAARGASTVTVTGKSGSLSQSAALSLTVLPPAAGTAGAVNLASAYNVMGVVTDGAVFFNSSGLDAGGRAYSANLLGPVQSVSGASFSLGLPNMPDAVTSATIPLPAGQFSTLVLLAAGVNGNQLNQTFTVSYTDGTTSTFTQSLSDWCYPQNYPGESQAIKMTYRDNSTGTRDTRPVALYGYSFNLPKGKTVRGISLPRNRNVVVLAISLK